MSKYALIYISPFLILLLILALQSWANTNFLWENYNPEVYSIPNLPKCYGEGCITLAYAVNGDEHPYIQHTIQYIKKVNDLPDDQIKRWNMSLTQVIKKLEASPNKTQAVVVFCTTGSWEIGDFKVPCYADDYHLNTYTIIFNLTLFHRVPFFSNLKGAYPKDMTTVKLKKDIDEGIISYYNKNSRLNITTSDFPSKNSRFITGFSIFAQYGSFFIMIPYLVLMVMQGSQKLKQKQDRLRVGLNIVGVTHFQFYLIEAFTYFISVVVISASFCLAGLVFQVKFWSNAILWFDFVVLVVNGFTIGLVVFCITAVVKSKNLGMSIIYGFVLYSIVMQWLFSGGYILQLLYMDTASTFVKVLKYIFNLYPSYHFTKIFADISRTADNHFDTLQNRYVEGRPFVYQDLFFKRSQSFQKPFPRSYTLPNSLQSLLYMSLVALLYAFILLILDRYIESNRGYSQPFCPNFRKRRRSIYGANQLQNQSHSMVKIINLKKTYSNNVHALKGVSVQLNRGQIVSLLGENGAGKSTLINILIGVLAPTNGEASVEGMNLQTQRNQIRKIIGVCPQFDILWEEMTAEQHVKMFCQIKGWPDSDDQIKKCLDSVYLYENRSGKVKTFSGGMRRRLSLAISLIGNPKLVILDQPTTGMDAKIRLQTWKIILRLRDRKRTMLITTHNMEESECLSDRILIMSKGKVVAEGTTAELKSKYGQGYVITGIKSETGEKVSLKFKQDELEEGMKRIQKQGLEHWSLQQTTLEQVFLNVSNRY